MANKCKYFLPSIEGGSNVTRNLLGNFLIGKTSGPIPNVVPPNGARLAALALDDFRELGEHDLALNHGDR
jgi:hypothetical protein